MNTIKSNTTNKLVQVELVWRKEPRRNRVCRAYSDGYVLRLMNGVPSFVLITSGVRLTHFQRDTDRDWYVDLVKVECTEPDYYRVTDMAIDIWIGADPRKYRIIDLHELIDQWEDGHITSGELADTLMSLQQFLEEYLHGHYCPLNFPPTSIQPYLRNGARAARQ